MVDTALIVNSNPPQNHRYASVQALRGIWALLIVAFHAVVMLRDRFGIEVGTFGGAAGVDLFWGCTS